MTLVSDPSHGLLTGTSMGAVPSALTTAIAYSSFGERTSDAATYGATPLYSNTYPVRDDLGRILQKVEIVEGVERRYAYSYDPAGRLDVVEVRDAANVLLSSTDYDHDLNGNRTHVNGTPIATHDAQDRLLSYGPKSFTYSEAGELETLTEAGQTTTYGYDGLGSLRTVTLPDATQIEYVIDGLNRRVGKRVNGTLQQGFLYGDQLRVAAELDGSGAVVSRFVYATRPNVPEYMVKGSATYRLLTDHLGSVRLVVNVATGAIAQRIDYDAFGVVTSDTSPGFQPFGFAGGLYDRDTGLVRFGARDYDASTGRWTAKDPIRFRSGDANLYAYALADPMSLADPEGEVSLSDVANFAAGFGNALSFGLTGLINRLSGASDVLNPCSDAFNAGELAGFGLTAVSGLAGLARAGAKTVSSAVGGRITGYTSHGLNQAISRNGVGVSPSAVLDAVRNPSAVVEQASGAVEYVGESATVILNQAGKVITAWARGRSGVRIR
jgi:RHS repeat-associated protein